MIVKLTKPQADALGRVVPSFEELPYTSTKKGVELDLTEAQIAYFVGGALEWSDPLEVELGHTTKREAATLRAAAKALGRALGGAP